MALTAYQQQVQRLLHDPQANYYPLLDLTAYINLARGQIALEGQCVRVLLPSTGPINSITVTAVGSGYLSAPAVVITGVGTGAAAHAVLSGNTVSSVVVDNPGSGYDKTTTVSLTGGSGTGATAVANLVVNNTVTGQELYFFSNLAAVAQASGPGIQGILGLISISTSWGSLKPTMEQRDWSTFQALFRAYNTGLQNFPGVWAQYQYGANGSVYVWPIPSQILQWDWDTYCRPLDLVDDTTAEAIPYPWTDCVPFYAAHLAFDNSQRKGDSDRMFNTYTMFMKRARAMSEGPFVPNIYDTGDGGW